MKIAIGADHGGFSLKKEVKEHLMKHGHEVVDFGTDCEDSVDYPIYAAKVSRSIVKGECELGILICGTGLGISMAANKVPGIRAAVCSDTYSARMAREHNNANILALGARVVGVGLALDIVDIFLKTEFAGGRHSRRIDLISALERGEEL